MPNSQPFSSSLLAAIERSGYYPALVAEAVEDAVGSEAVLGHLVHQETTFDADEVRRHVTVLAVTPTRLIAGHTDEYGSDDPMAPVPPGSPESAATGFPSWNNSRGRKWAEIGGVGSETGMQEGSG